MVSRLKPLLIAALLTLAPLVCRAAPPADFARNADALIRAEVAAQTFSGVVLVAKDGKPVFRRAYGLANREWSLSADPETVFRIGSTTKSFTAAAILQMVEQGRLKLNDPASAYLPDLPRAWAGVTIRHLLSHESGIADYVQVNGFIRGPARLDLTPTQLVDLVREEPLQFKPGSDFRYSNTGYVLLGLILEKLSGQTYGDYLAAHVLAPAGLSHTAYDDDRQVVPRRAAGYGLSDGALKVARPMTTASAYAAGGLRSTADDLLAWDRALSAGQALSSASVAAMFTDYGHGYGFGSFVETRHGHRLLDHGGNLSGFATAFDRYPDDGLTVIVLSNIEGGEAERLAAALAGAWFGWPPRR
jgi:CubicO group peptidase (beta-lactamase class C family)